MQRFKRRPLAAAMLMVFSAPEWALAQAQAEQTMPEVRVRGAQEGFAPATTSTGTRTETPLRDIPQFINTVPQEVIRSQAATSLGDALRNVPGISYAAPEGGTQANNVYYLRGFPAGGDIFLDGIRDLGEYNRDLFNTEQVEVLKGPSALMFGRGSTGGIIHQVSKQPGLLGMKEVAFEFGSDKKRRLTADLNVKTGDSAAFRLNALAEDSDYYRYPQGQEKYGIAPSFRFGIGERTDVTLSYFYLKTKDVTDYGQPTLFTAGAGFFGMPPVSPRKYYGFEQHDYTDHETNMATLKVEHQFSSALTLRNTTRWSTYQREMEATHATLNKTDANGKAVTTSTPHELLLVNRQHNKSRDTDDSSLINQTELTWKLATGAVKQTVLGGLELAKEQLDRWNYTFAGTFSSTTPLLNPDPSNSLSYTKTPNQRSVADAETMALYAQDQFEFGQHWKALVGLRWERFDSTVITRDYNTGATVANGGPFARVDEVWSGRLGVMWQPTAGQSYYISGGNSYNPSGELGVYGGNGTNLNASQDDLAPEKNVIVEAGSQWNWRELRLRTSVFRNEKTNQRATDELGNITLGGKRRVDGIEMELAGRITPAWDVIASIAWMTGEILSASANAGGQATVGKKPLGVPSESGSLWTVYHFPGGWEIGGGAFWSQEKFLDDANTGQIPEYTRWDATLAYVQKKYEVRLNFMNLTDEVYYYGGYNNSPNRVLPGQPRSTFLTLRYNFDG
jgi:catecholate siderophore receptor